MFGNIASAIGSSGTALPQAPQPTTTSGLGGLGSMLRPGAATGPTLGGIAGPKPTGINPGGQMMPWGIQPPTYTFGPQAGGVTQQQQGLFGMPMGGMMGGFTMPQQGFAQAQPAAPQAQQQAPQMPQIHPALIQALIGHFRQNPQLLHQLMGAR